MNTVSTSKLRTYLLGCALAATAVVSTSHAFAQSSDMRVSVPFTFHSGSQIMPAGVYRVKIESDQLVLLRGDSKSGYVMTQPQIGKAKDSGRLVFQRYGDQYFLREVWASASTTGQKCVKSKLEREVEIAQSKSARTGAEVALNQQPQ
jgi:hypothetical protein